MLLLGHRRRINIEEKAKVVAATWGTKFIQFLAVPVILHYRTILKNRKRGSSSYSSNRPITKQLAQHGIDEILSPKQQR